MVYTNELIPIYGSSDQQGNMYHYYLFDHKYARMYIHVHACTCMYMLGN